MTCILPGIARLDLNIRRGSTFELTLHIPGDVPLDQVVWAGAMKRRKTDTAVAAELEVLLLPDRWLFIGLNTIQTQALDLSRYVYDITATVGIVTTPVLEGAALVTVGPTACEAVNLAAMNNEILVAINGDILSVSRAA